MWAGPFCTWLLASMGCEVVTIEGPCRPDGLRGSPAHFETLAEGKRRLPLDLRRAQDRRVFERLVRTADLVVESYSSRVMPNLGYGPEDLRELNPTLTTLSIRAFDRVADERSWVSYGSGVHAASGHGMVDGEPRPATHAYADALTGLAAAGELWRIIGADHVPAAVVVGMDRVVDGLGPTSPPPTVEEIRRLVDRVGTGGRLPLVVDGARRG
jgi:crotonobetainyl-CoA:carnitine CoA-transferase CaiB-like acyl-CoA transferase